MSDKTCECEEPWWDTDLQGRDYPCRKCGGMVPNFPDMMEKREPTFGRMKLFPYQEAAIDALEKGEMRSPTGRSGRPLVLTSGVWADLLQDGESFEIMEADGSRRHVKKGDVEIVSVDYGEIEARAYAHIIACTSEPIIPLDDDDGGRRFFVIDDSTSFEKNRQLETYAEGFRSMSEDVKEVKAGAEYEPADYRNRQGRRIRAAQARKRWK